MEILNSDIEGLKEIMRRYNETHKKIDNYQKEINEIQKKLNNLISYLETLKTFETGIYEKIAERNNIPVEKVAAEIINYLK